MTARDHWRQVQRETTERRHDRARLLIAEAEGQEAVKMYHSTPCITGRHRECGDAACTCRCGHQGRLLPVKMKDDPAAKSSAATAAVLDSGSVKVGHACADCGRPLSDLDAAFVSCDECWYRFYQQASPFERQQARERR